MSALPEKDMSQPLTLKELEQRFEAMFNGFWTAYEKCKENSERCDKKGKRVRLTILMLTLVIAILNFLNSAASAEDATQSTSCMMVFLANLLGKGQGAVFAGIISIVLGTIITLESTWRFSQKAKGYRQAMDMYLDLYYEHRMCWVELVEKNKPEPKALENAIEQLRKIVEAHSQARARVRDLTDIPNQPDGADTKK